MNHVVIPIALPILAAMLCVLMRSTPSAQRLLSGITAITLPIYGWWLLGIVRDEGPQVLRAGNWPDAFGIVFAADLLSAIMLLFSSCTFTAVWWFLVAGGAKPEQEKALLYPVLLILVGGVNWSMLTGDLFNLFVGFEIVLIACYVLLVHGNEAAQVRETIKYVVLNIIAGGLFLITAGFAYGMFGSLNMAELALRIQAAGFPPEAIVFGIMMMLVFFMKSAVFPLYFWLPDAYPKAPPGIVAYMSGIMTKMAIYCLYRFFTLMFPADVFSEWFQRTMMVIGGLTMFIGVMGAYSQYTFRRILSFHIISQIGYMVFALSIYTPMALAFGIFFVVHNMLVKSSLLLVGDCVLLNEGSEDLRKVSGLIKNYPWLSVIFLLAALSLVGIPPFSGFYGKFGLVMEGFREGHHFFAAVALLTGLFTMASMMKIWNYAFWGERPANAAPPGKKNGLIIATGGLVTASLVLALGSGFFIRIMSTSGEELLDRRPYVGAVLGERGLAQLDAKPPVEVTMP